MAQRTAGQIPPEQTTFVGRAADLSRLETMLADTRLVTVTGAGGVGKTRLALRAASAAGSSFPDGVCLAELSGLRDPELLANTVAAVLELPEQDPRPRLEQVLDYLDDRRTLLILDTCEHLVEACALLAETVLARTQHVTILATSREPLFVAGEHEYPLSPLAVPGPETGPGGIRALPASGAGEPEAGDAVELFIQRAGAVVPGFTATGADRAAIARLCRHLDGIPLAIELAAVQLRGVSLGELAERMDRHFLDLTGRQPGAAGRHQTLRDAIGWSYELCTPGERLLWERLSVFSGPVTPEAAAQVCAGPGLDAGDVLDALIGLVDKSVITRTGGDVSRYRMLDTIREYGADRLADSGTQDRVRARHLRRYLTLASEFAARPLDRQLPRYQLLRAEHSDLRTALEYAAGLPGPVTTGHPAVQLPARLEWYWVISARFQEGRYWLTRGLSRSPEPGPDRIEALITRGYLTGYQGEQEPSLADAREAVALEAKLGDRQVRAHALVYLSYNLLAASLLEEAKTAADEAGRLLGPEDAPGGLPAVLATIMAYMDLLSGDAESCLRVCERALRELPSDGDERWASGYLFGLAGLAMCLLGQPGDGNRSCLRGLVLKQELGDMVGLAHGLGVAALVAGAQQRHERAAWLIGATDPLWKRIGLTFIGVDIMQALTDQAAQDARTAIGEHRYADVIRDAAARPLDQVIDLAVRDADRLPALPPTA